MKRHAFAGIFAAAVLTAGATLSAQQGVVAAPQPAPGQPPVPGFQQMQFPQYPAADANEVRNQLHDLLRMYPPALSQVLRADPSLAARQDYLTPYPQLNLFLQQHPEVLRTPEFYFGSVNWEYRERREPLPPEVEALGVLLGGMGGALGVAAVLGVLTWLVRATINHRRWVRSSRIQTEVHAKIMDRMTTNEELLAYVQSPAGRRFLESAPPPEAAPAQTSAPVGPIIWAMMAGIVLATAGIGFRYSAGTLDSDASQAFNVVGVIILALGVGFILSSLMAYLVSSRLGLFPQRPSTDPSSDHA